jgi:ferredoxin-type protein NapF
MNRRDLFKRGLKTSFVYPPYYENISDFSSCVECESRDCLIACEENIITIKNDRAVIEFNTSGCTFCDECANVCKLGVLKLEHKRDKLNCEVIINPQTCVAWNQTICFSCSDVCPEKAINFRGMFNPIIDEEKCTSCGFCVGVCPSGSVVVTIT